MAARNLIERVSNIEQCRRVVITRIRGQLSGVDPRLVV
jgi:hypothetical protein